MKRSMVRGVWALAVVIAACAQPPAGPADDDNESFYSCFGPPHPESVWAEQEPAEGIEHPGLGTLESDLGGAGLEGWFLLQADDERLSVARERDEPLSPRDDILRTHDVVSVRDFGGDNGWHSEQWTSCTPQLVAEGLGAADVWLDGEPDPAASRLELLVKELGCAGGQSAEGRVQVLSLDGDAETVAVTVLVEPLGGNQTCPGNPLTPVVIQLDEPLGDRDVIDTSVFPPRRLDPAP